MIIKAGTYRLNDNPNFTSDFSISIPFTCTFDYEEEGVTKTIWFSCEGISASLIQIDNYALFYNCIDSNYGELSGETITYPTPMYAYMNGSFMISGMQIITVTADTAVEDEATFTWFTENTQMLIKAGTYRWNDTLTELSTTDVVLIPFTTPNIVLDDNVTDVKDVTAKIDGELQYIGFIKTIIDGSNETSFDFVMTHDSTSYPVTTTSQEVYCYSNGDYDGWFGDFYYNMVVTEGAPEGNVSKLSDTYRYITITEDTFVPPEFGLWADENWQPYEETDIKAVYLRKNGEWVKQTAYQMQNGKWVKISEADSGKITDLTDTTWYIPIGADIPSGRGIFSVNMKVYVNTTTLNNPYSKLKIGYDGDTASAGYITVTYLDNSGNEISWRNKNTKSFTFTFTGGTDVTNADLIAWLYATGELQ